MTKPEVDQDELEDFIGGGMLKANEGHAFKLEITALALFGMEDLYRGQKGFFKKGNLNIWFPKINGEEYGNFISADGEYILEYFDHTEEINSKVRTNRITFCKFSDKYVFTGEYVALNVARQEDRSLTIWKRIGTQFQSLI
ncbi:MAG: hypothetical protein LKJ47_04240 [Bifidobacteriaceae bacterium]|jgi:hypothetical protein|nr:hypothetical protein [Bifidobacteriaceae bacterium]